MTVTAPQRVQRHGTRSRYVAGCRCDPCRAAAAAYRAQYAKGSGRTWGHGKRRPFTADPQVPAQPLLEAVYAYLRPQGLGVHSLSTRDAQAIWRAVKSGTVSCHVADRIIVGTLGRHPAEVYGWEWYTLEATDGA